MTDPSSADAAQRQYGRIPGFKGFLPLNADASPMATHGSGALSSLIRVRSSASIHSSPNRRLSSHAGRDTIDDEEALGDFAGRRLRDVDDPFRASQERRASEVLMTPQMRSMRLIGNNNPRYRWRQYWKTEEELKTMKKPL